uniref:Uncharacterized protein n=1 Tax=Rhizophora mucronata TaxID=61149 RepID=A0A2P2N268_RHIMU
MTKTLQYKPTLQFHSSLLALCIRIKGRGAAAFSSSTHLVTLKTKFQSIVILTRIHFIT